MQFAKLGGDASAAAPLTQAITNIGFQPKAVILFSSGSNLDLTSPMRPGLGMSTSTDHRSISWGSDDNVNYTTAPGINAFRRASEEYAFMLAAGTGTGGYAKIKVDSFSSATSGTMNLLYEDNDTATYNINAIFLGGADITNQKVGSFNLPTTSGNVDIDVGFQPDVVFFFGANVIPQTGADTTGSTPGASWFLGAASSQGAANQAVTAGMSLDALTGAAGSPPPHAARYQNKGSSGSCIAIFDGTTFPTDATSLWAEARFVSMVSTGTGGFRLNVTNPPASTTEASERPIFYLALKGARWNVGSFTSPVDPNTGPQTVTGTPAIGSYTPKGIMLWTDMDTPRTAPVPTVTNHRYSIGSAEMTTPFQWTGLAGDNNAPTNDGTPNTTWTIRGTLAGSPGAGTGAVVRTGVEREVPDPARDISSSAQLSSFGSGQFVLNWTKVDANGREVLYVTGGDSPAGAALVKAPTMASPADLQITESLVKKRGLVRKTTPLTPDISISESLRKLRGMVKIVGAIPGTVGGGFMPAGFLASGFVTGVAEAAAPDYNADYNSDYSITGGAPVSPVPTGQEYVGLYETVLKKLSNAALEYVTPANIVLMYSGGSSYDGSASGGGATLSIGGSISNVQVASGTALSAWDNVSGPDASAGDTEYRLFYIKNTHPDLTAYSVRIWVGVQTPGGDRVEIAIAAALVNNTEPVPSGGTENDPPSGVSFSTAPDENGSLLVGDLPPAGGYRGIWIKRIVPASTISYIDNSYSLKISFVSSHA